MKSSNTDSPTSFLDHQVSLEGWANSMANIIKRIKGNTLVALSLQYHNILLATLDFDPGVWDLPFFATITRDYILSSKGNPNNNLETLLAL